MKKTRIRAFLCVVFILALAVSACGGRGGSGDGGGGILVPAAPGGMSATAGDAQITLTWNAVNGADTYTLYWAASAGVTTASTSITAVTAPYTHTGLTNGKAYHYAVTAVNAAGESVLSTEVSATPQTVLLPNPPVGVGVTGGDKQNTITWIPVSGAQSYNIYWSTSTGVTRTTGTKIAGVTSPYVHTGLMNGTTYYYVVTAVNAAGESAESAQVAGMPLLPGPGAPSAQAGVQAVTIQWQPVPGAISHNLYWSDTAVVTTATGTKITNVTSPYKHANMRTGTYYYIVTAVTPEGESGPSAVVAAPVNLVSFLTSVKGNGNLKSWPYTGSAQPGLDAGDTVCQVSANLAGLYGTFRAWLSDDTSDAYCRVHNLTGKKSAKCGQSSLPVSAGPWIRTDGTPFAGTISNLVHPVNQVYSPARFDETGAEVTNPTTYRTATDQTGVLKSTGTYTSTCSNWTSTSFSGSSVTGGHSLIAGNGITDVTSMLCVGDYPLLCFQTDAGPALPASTSAGKKAFITSKSGSGNLGSWADAGGATGLAAGDAICQSRAASAGLTGFFKAWLSDSATNAVDRFSSNGPWVTLDGIKVAGSKADLIDGTLFTAIDRTETGTYLTNHGVWTGSNDNGTKTVNHCNNWTDNTALFFGTAGSAYKAGSGWSTTWPNTLCNSTWIYLYCLED